MGCSDSTRHCTDYPALQERANGYKKKAKSWRKSEEGKAERIE
jgi:hypothetical protein